MRLLVPLLRALCIALLLPATVMATAQMNHVPARHDCCESAALISHHADPAIHGADSTSEDHFARSREPRHFFSGLHACNWIKGPEFVAKRPFVITWAPYAPLGDTTLPSARAESLHRPSAAHS